MLGGLELIILAVVFGSIGLWGWSIVDILNRPAHQWKAIGQERALWLMVVLFVGLPGSIGYLLAIRPKLARIAELGPAAAYPMLGAAPPGWYPDPQGSHMMRWFDGQQWTANFAPPGTVPMGGMPVGPPMGPPSGGPGYYPPGR